MTTMSDKELRNSLSALRSEKRKRDKAAHQHAVQSCNADLLKNLAESIRLLCPHPHDKVLTQTNREFSKQTCLCCKQTRTALSGKPYRAWRVD
jgi:hypothetical protein